ncbi:ferredoxin-like protein [Chloroflexota bacterium]
MHHSLRIYSRYREWILRYYIFQSKWTKIPLVGKLVRWLANKFGENVEQGYLLTASEAEAIIDCSVKLALGPCTCRAVFKNCENPVYAEIMVGCTQDVFIEQRPHDYREITKQEAKEILIECRQKGLIHTIMKFQKSFYAMCNCCDCCCVPLRLRNKYGIGNALKRHKDIVGEFKKQLVSQI